MDRYSLINYSLFYEGDYRKICNAIKNNEDVGKDDRQVEAITIFDNEYPKRLFELKYPPLVLYYKGDLSLLNEPSIAIVGSRMACEYALNATKAVCKANTNNVIISGVALGIDTCAHKHANKTVGILGCGIDYIYPSSNYDLFKHIERNGLLLSEYPFKVKPLAYHFPFRNRIIAGLASKVYIMQSTLASGTMTTVNEALELGREIKVLPYDVFNKFGVNNNNLIYEGATPITSKEIAF